MRSPGETTIETVVMDWTQVNWMHAKVLALSVIDFTLYGIILYAVSSIPDPVFASFAVFIAQISVGLPTTRTFHSLGQKARRYLVLQDPSNVNTHWKTVETKSNPEMISRAFEKGSSSLDKKEPQKTDDMNDLAWFAVLSWAIVSAALLQSILTVAYVAILSTALLAGMALVVYLSGYWSTGTPYLLDSLDELEFYILKRLAKLLGTSMGGPCQVYTIWLRKNSQRILFDIAFDVSVDTDTDQTAKIRYLMGLPSKEYERLIITSSEQVSAEMIQRVHRLRLVAARGWMVEPLDTSRGLKVSIMNPDQILQYLPSQTLFVQSLDMDEDLDWLADAINNAADTLKNI
ncbi:MAG: hypothetical protein ACW99U_08365 [Candidatus Thorarchaeota archaeon]|jgi:hypothetical protein